MKTCRTCKIDKDLDSFYRSRNADGRETQCKKCKGESRKARMAKTPGRQTAYNKSWAVKFPDKARQVARNNERNRDPIKVRKIQRDAQARRRARKRAAFVDDVRSDVVLDQHEGICGICLVPVDPNDFHVDHRVPLAKGGEHSYSNTQPAHPKCNLMKSDKLLAA